MSGLPVRRAAGAAYEAAGLGDLVSLPRPSDGVVPAWHLFVVRSAHADDLAEALTVDSIGSKAYYRMPIHRQPAMREFAPDGDLQATDEAARMHLAVPMSLVLTAEQAREVVRWRGGGSGGSPPRPAPRDAGVAAQATFLDAALRRSS
jgi:dTDP-4-amino-4,6-dideoxygalactose transaminase